MLTRRTGATSIFIAPVWSAPARRRHSSLHDLGDTTKLRLLTLCRAVDILSGPSLVRHLTKAMHCRPLVFALFLSAFAATAQEWTRFRGPNGSGISSDTGFPTEFNKRKNLIWRTAVR